MGEDARRRYLPLRESRLRLVFGQYVLKSDAEIPLPRAR